MIDRPPARFDTSEWNGTKTSLNLMFHVIMPIRDQHQYTVGNPIFTALKDKLAEVADHDR